jgi:hypothetical protein
MITMGFINVKKRKISVDNKKSGRLGPPFSFYVDAVGYGIVYDTKVSLPEGDFAVIRKITPEQVFPSAGVSNIWCTEPSWTVKSERDLMLSTLLGATAPATHAVASEDSALNVVPDARGKQGAAPGVPPQGVVLFARNVSCRALDETIVITASLVAINSVTCARTVVADVVLSQVLARLGLPQLPDEQLALAPRRSTNSPSSYDPFSLSSR